MRVTFDYLPEFERGAKALERIKDGLARRPIGKVKVNRPLILILKVESLISVKN